MTARVWHLHPPKAPPKKPKRSTAKARSTAPVLQVPAEESPQDLVQPVTGRSAAMPLASAQQTAPPPVASPSSGSAAPPAVQVPIPERAPAYRTPKRAKAQPDAQYSWSPWPRGSEPDTAATGAAPEPAPEPDQRPAWMISSRPPGAPDARALEVAHDSDSGVRGQSEPPAPFARTSWPSPDANLLPLLRPAPQPSPFPEVGAFPEASPELGADHGLESARPELAASAEYGAPARSEPAAGPARRPFSGLIPAGLIPAGLISGLGRKPGRAAGSAAPAPPAEASSAAEAGPQTTPARPQVPVMPAKPRVGWMLRVQSRPAAAPALDRPASAEPAPPATSVLPAPVPAPATAPAPVPAATSTGAVRVRFGASQYRWAHRGYPRAGGSYVAHACLAGHRALASRVCTADTGTRARAARLT